MCLLQALLRRADRYAGQSTWKDFALVKICLAALGILIGLNIPAGKRKGVGFCATLAFLHTYVLLLTRFLPFLTAEDEA